MAFISESASLLFKKKKKLSFFCFSLSGIKWKHFIRTCYSALNI